MNKLTKGAIAGAAGIALLLGGAGSFALWNATSTVAGGTITSGTLNMATVGSAVWTDTTTNTVINPSTFRIVPGDTIAVTQQLTVAGTGNDLSATLANNGATLAGTLASSLGTPTVVQTLTASDSTPIAGNTVTVGNVPVTVNATVTFTFPFGTTVDNTSQAKAATLSDVQFTLTQNQP
ncbi:alternate-type signal peptide domain-containing protein [Rathayibacter soli]|uniref:alternate-type signal peptide domain-containing protein n=1 Tax=Rathayibacter soli TaxID=3144168 RepID=UPI0027E43AA3|nr:alternate-type signal peptide domain-containing protein [Glaciibacter superstes]